MTSTIRICSLREVMHSLIIDHMNTSISLSTSCEDKRELRRDILPYLTHQEKCMLMEYKYLCLLLYMVKCDRVDERVIVGHMDGRIGGMSPSHLLDYDRKVPYDDVDFIW